MITTTTWRHPISEADITALAVLDPGCAAPCTAPDCPCGSLLPS